MINIFICDDDKTHLNAMNKLIGNGDSDQISNYPAGKNSSCYWRI